jgi:two-component system, NtrC family, sensor kinase
MLPMTMSIPVKQGLKVFDPFFTTKPVGKGTGQGLALSHSVIVRKHQGTISFESAIGVGTTFLIRLPLALATEAA